MGKFNKWLAKQEELSIVGWLALIGLLAFFIWDTYIQPLFQQGLSTPSVTWKVSVPEWMWLTIGIGIGVILISYGALKIRHVKKTAEGLAIRITPREGMPVDEERVREMGLKMNMFRRRWHARVRDGRVWLRWLMHRDRKDGKVHVWLVAPPDQVSRAKRILTNCYPECELRVEPKLPLPQGKGEGGHLKLVKGEGTEKAYGIQEGINRIGNLINMMNQGSYIDIRFTPTDRERLTKPGQQLVQKLTRGKKEKWTMRTLEDRKKIEAATDRYLEHLAYSVSISLWDSRGSISGLAGEINSSYRRHNALKLHRYIFFPALRNAVAWKMSFSLPWRRLVMSDGELANFFMFPDPDDEHVHKKLVRLAQGQRSLGKKEFHEGYTVGSLLHPFGNQRPVKVPTRQFVWHPVVMGATGSGKGAFITTFAEEFLKGWATDPVNHAGWTFVDPHRTTILKILSQLLKMEQEGYTIDWDRIHYFYLGPNDYPVGMNLLYKQEGDDLDQLTEQAAELIKAAYPGELSRTSVLIENGIATLLADNKLHTIAELPRLFQDKAFRNGILKRVKNPAVREFWANEDRKKKGEANIDAMLTRLNPFFRNTSMQRMFGQSKNVIDARTFFKEGHIVLVDMNGVSPATFQLAGGWITNQYHNEAARRISGRHHYYWIDEAPVLRKVTTFVQGVQEDRKRGLGYGIITQDVDKLDKDLMETLKVNSGIVVSLNPGSGAKKAANLLGNNFSPEYLQGQNTLEAAMWVRSMGTVTMKLKPPVYYLNGKPTKEDSPEEREAGDIALKKAMELQKRSGEGTPVKKVDEEILTRYQQGGG